MKKSKDIFKQVNALDESHGKLLVPLVVGTKKINNKEFIVGYIPGLLTDDIVASSVEECKINLNNFARETIKNMYDNNEPFPFFPTREQILEDYDNVIEINFLSISLKD